MKSKSFNQQQLLSLGIAQSGMVPQFMPMRTSNIGRDYSNEAKIRRVSPAPQERFSHLSTNYSFPITPFQGNQYQLPIRNDSQPHFEYKKAIQDLAARIQKLEMRTERSEKMEFRVEKLQAVTKKMQSKVDSSLGRIEDSLQGTENRQNLQNCSNKNDEDLKQRLKNLITREELQRQLIGLDSAFKTLIKEIKLNTNTEMREVHTKEKKAMIEVVASQISDKLQAFKESFIADLNNRIEIAVKENLGKELINKSVIGLSKEKFIGTAVPIKVKEEMSYSIGGVERDLTKIETTYFIDSQGFIMDSNLNYLLDKTDSKIKLSQGHIQVLRREGLLSLSKGFNEK